MYADPSHPEPTLTGHLRNWLASHPDWEWRSDEPEDSSGQFGIFWTQPSIRAASADEIAAEIVDDPAVGETLCFLASSEGQAVEDAVARLYLPAGEAQLLTSALTRAWQIVLDQHRATRQRGAVLAGAVIATIAIFALAGRAQR